VAPRMMRPFIIAGYDGEFRRILASPLGGESLTLLTRLTPFSV